MTCHFEKRTRKQDDRQTDVADSTIQSAAQKNKIRSSCTCNDEMIAILTKQPQPQRNKQPQQDTSENNNHIEIT